MKWRPFHLWNFLSVEFQTNPDFTSFSLLFFRCHGFTQHPPLPTYVLNLVWRQLPCAASSSPCPPQPGPAPTLPVTVVHFCKLRSFPHPCLSLSDTFQFAHFSFQSVIYRMKHSFSVLQVNRWTESSLLHVLLMDTLSSPNSWLQLCSVCHRDWQRDPRARTPTLTPCPLKTHSVSLLTAVEGMNFPGPSLQDGSRGVHVWWLAGPWSILHHS